MANMRFCTWNIQLGFKLSSVVHQLKKQKDFVDLDLLALQEASVHKEEEDAAIIARTLGKDYDYFQFSTHQYLRWQQANALVWNAKRFSVDTIDTIHLPKSFESQLPAWERRLLHFIPKQQRNCVIVEGTLKKKKVRVYVTHLDVVGYTHRLEQLRAVFMAEETREPVDMTIIAGDMNTIHVPSRHVWREFAEQVESFEFQDITTDVEWSHVVSRPLRIKQKLDAIFIKPGTVPYQSWNLDIRSSDHVPVFADIAFA